MTQDQIKAAVYEAKRFITRANAALAEMKEDDHRRYYCGTKASGALRRASMDLTRALAEMRKW